LVRVRGTWNWSCRYLTLFAEERETGDLPLNPLVPGNVPIAAPLWLPLGGRCGSVADPPDAER
jgi:hypothetical protein